MKAVELKTEYLRNPLAIDIKSPKLSWRATEGIRQTAYHVEAHPSLPPIALLACP